MHAVPAIRTRLWLGGLASGGVVAAHWLAYRLTTPAGHHESEILHSTGHRYWTWFMALALGALVAGLAGFAHQRLRAIAPVGPGALYRYSLGRLIALQATGFLLLEIFERLASHGSLDLAHQPAVVLGVALQILIAFAGALLLVAFGRVIDGLRAVGARPAVRESLGHFESQIASMRPRMALGGRTLRGPPDLLLG